MTSCAVFLEFDNDGFVITRDIGRNLDSLEGVSEHTVHWPASQLLGPNSMVALHCQSSEPSSTGHIHMVINPGCSFVLLGCCCKWREMWLAQQQLQSSTVLGGWWQEVQFWRHSGTKSRLDREYLGIKCAHKLIFLFFSLSYPLSFVRPIQGDHML